MHRLGPCRLAPLAVLLAAGVLGAPAGAADAPPASASTPPDAADDAFRRGNLAYKEGRWQDAYDAYRLAWQSRRAFDVAGNLGDVELRLGKPRDAAEHLAWSLRAFPPSGKAEARERTKERFEQARRLVATLAVRVDVPGAEVIVDGHAVGRAPLEDEVYVEPGTHTLEAKLAGHEPGRTTHEAIAGERREIALHLIASQVAAAPAPPVAREPAPASRSPVPAYVGGAVALAGVGVGVGYLVAAHGRQADADARPIAGGTSACLDPANAAACGARNGALDDAHRDRTLAAVGFVVGGVAAAVTVAYLVWPRSDAASRGGVRVVPAANASGGAMFVSGDF